MLRIENVVTDRRSRYAVSGGAAASAPEAEELVRTLTRPRKYAKATHNTWAVLLENEAGTRTPLKADDGEAGAGMVILRMMEREGLVNHVVMVTRWYGGVKLGGDRFRHIQQAVRAYLAELAKDTG